MYLNYIIMYDTISQHFSAVAGWVFYIQLGSLVQVGSLLRLTR